MTRVVFAFVGLLAFAFVDPAHAIVQETETSVTQTGTEIKTSTVTITQTGKERKTDKIETSEKKKTGKKKVRIDTRKTRKIEVTVTTEKTDGRTETKTIPVELSVFLEGGTTELVPGLTMRTEPVEVETPPRRRPRRPPTEVTTPAPTPTAMSGVPSGLTFGFYGGWANAESKFTPSLYRSIGVDEPTGHIPVSSSGSDVTFTASLGFNFSGMPTGLEAQFTRLDNEATIAGLPGNQFAATANDRLTIKKEWMASLAGFYYFAGPVQDSSWFLKAGLALVRETFTHHCPANGWCGVAPAAGAFSASDSRLNPGMLVGVGAQFRTWSLLGAPTYLRVYYEHIFVSGFDVQTGSPAIRAVSGNIDQDIDRIGIGFVMSDVRLKRDIVPLGRRADGFALYRYRYLWADTEYVGVMAQEVAQARPDAVVTTADGFLRVDYARLGLRLQTWDEWHAREAREARVPYIR